LAARLSGWNIDILTPGEFEQQRTKAGEQLASLTSVGADIARDLVSLGYISLADVAEAEPETLARVANVPMDQAKEIIAQAAVLVSESEANDAAATRAAERAAAALASASPDDLPASDVLAAEAPAADVPAAEALVAEAPAADAPAAEAPAVPEAAPEAGGDAPTGGESQPSDPSPPA
ncbi:MAG: helix-hairpin-helix domain-containing protein, partial [Planctomycetota bacterium]|nr:helix-hairpin-helix domain-containing protein [Planctomycetota bacterium]